MLNETHAEKHLKIKSGAKIDLGTLSADSTPGESHARAELDLAVSKLHIELEALQGRLWAESRQAVLLVLQALDTGGKDGTIRRVFGGVNPQGVTVHGFRAPVGEESKHDFLWRIYRALPSFGEIGIFNRSHYEDVVTTKVKSLIDAKEQHRRFEMIEAFEQHLVESGTKIIKVFLNISKDEQKSRLQARLDTPDKQWKFSKADLETRGQWDKYIEGYSQAISRTSFDFAPWYVVPADHKWYRDWAVINLMVDTLKQMNPQYPPPEDDLGKIVIT